ncbi:monooxygenase [Hygrophoropsis aurantiaca]|uniref:Monooxygenase n=1 Tax=Hygrophoropsis aurantiaca TaxID=72124 RepID=A0ACB8A4V1_9AGAM|nr:monooxygenase [Hygrophoropsis aurantiaca]
MEAIEVIVVGAGYAGLACAIECKRKGHRVLILEKVTQLKVMGDIISLGSNAGRIIARWGLHDKLWEICGHAPAFVLHNYLGELIQVQPLPQPLFGAYAYNGHRAQIHQVIFQHAIDIGIEIRMGQEVEGYWESNGSNKAGVLVKGKTLEADIVIAADGIKSQARQYVLGVSDNPKPSGYAIYRAWFDAVECGVDVDPLTNFLTKDGDVLYGWIGKDVHFLTSSSGNGKTISWVITHKDDSDIQDSWSSPGKIEDVLRIVEGWDSRCAAVISKAPSCIDWKLIVHDPLPTWISKTGRVVLVGDAAHPFLPTSVQGASQAIEDGVTLAVTLQLGKKDNVQLATRTWEAIRYDRVRRSQSLGESTRDKWHRIKPGDDHKDMDLPMPEWLHAFDAEEHARSVYDDVAKSILQRGYQLPAFL